MQVVNILYIYCDVNCFCALKSESNDPGLLLKDETWFAAGGIKASMVCIVLV